ncbi:hypothetical protein H9L19_02015 [Weissella diestrammenae]|uniref:ATPase P n=1 Tax=Weissella diestrammenae TaxID=1162633 RepID=A0A7G9T6F0_9LACO|nr:hypothetical protein [Weissella diestrammenae]MCM0583278.1 hypothetical protein [Weissella diestrammenae]QNN75675.1 hypothetical protein H9L19_02015 [Weissella diestrammenae]
MKVHYFRYALVMAVLSILSGILSINQVQTQISSNLSRWLILGGYGSSGALIIWLLLQMGRQNYHQHQINGSALFLPLTVAFAVWPLMTIYIELTRQSGHLLLSFPSMLLGLVGILLILGLQQRQLSVVENDDWKHIRTLNYWLILLAIYAAIFFSLTTSFLMGMVSTLVVLLASDASGPIRHVQQKRIALKQQLQLAQIKIIDWTKFDQLNQIKNIVIEKSGILTEPTAVIHSVKSVDDRYSDHDVTGIVAGLLENFATPLSRGFLQYARQNKVVPSTVSEPDKMQLVGIAGVIHQERFAVVSAKEALKNYAVSASYLDTFEKIGNSVVYVIDSVQVIGVVNYSLPLSYDMIDMDRDLIRRQIKTQVISTDTSGALQALTSLLHSADLLVSDVSPQEKIKRQVDLLSDPQTMLLTNQQIPSQMPKRVVVEAGDSLPFVTAQITGIGALGQLFDAAAQWHRINHRQLWVDCLIAGLIPLILLIIIFLVGRYFVMMPLIIVVIGVIANLRQR